MRISLCGRCLGLLLYFAGLCSLDLRCDSPNLLKLDIWLPEIKVILVDLGCEGVLGLTVHKFDIYRVSVLLFCVLSVLYRAVEIDVRITICVSLVLFELELEVLNNFRSVSSTCVVLSPLGPLQFLGSLGFLLRSDLLLLIEMFNNIVGC